MWSMWLSWRSLSRLYGDPSSNIGGCISSFTFCKIDKCNFSGRSYMRQRATLTPWVAPSLERRNTSGKAKLARNLLDQRLLSFAGVEKAFHHVRNVYKDSETVCHVKSRLSGSTFHFNRKKYPSVDSPTSTKSLKTSYFDAVSSERPIIYLGKGIPRSESRYFISRAQWTSSVSTPLMVAIP